MSDCDLMVSPICSKKDSYKLEYYDINGEAVYVCNNCVYENILEITVGR